MFVVKISQNTEFLSETKIKNSAIESSMDHYAVNIIFVTKICCVVSEAIFKCSFCNNEIFLNWSTGCWHHCIIYNVCRYSLIINWVFGFLSTIASMAARKWLNSFSIMGDNHWVFISTATIAEFFHSSIKDFWHLMMFREMADD